MKFFLITFLTLFIFQVNGQNLNDNQWNVLSSAGNEFSTTEHSLSWVLGEPMIESYASNNFILNQGFLHEYARVVPTKELLPDIQVQVFPNPVRETLNIVTSFEHPLYVGLTNLLGQEVFGNHLFQKRTKISMEGLNSGLYFLSFYNERHQFLKTEKIQKSH